LNNLFAKLLENEPTKWGNGISALWSGMSLSLYSKSLFNNNSFEFEKHQFEFESARSAIFHFLKFKNIGTSDEVMLCSFTCDAVSDAVKATGCNLVYIDVNSDLSMNFDDLKSKISNKTRLIICQNSFGVLGLNNNELNQLKKKNISTLLDNCLSYGSDYSLDEHLFDACVFSFEVSKIICVGWGGILEVSKNQIINFNEYHCKLKTVSLFEDLRRVFQTYLNLIFVGKGVIFFKFFWYLFFLLKIFRKSSTSSNDFSKSKKLGYFSSKILLNVLRSKSVIFSKTKKNFSHFFDYTQKLGYKTIYIDNNINNIVSCRLPLLIEASKRDDFIDLALKKYKLEIGLWFDKFPENNIDKNEFQNTSNILQCIVNIPCYWTLTNKDINTINSFLKFFNNNNVE
jgi:dTDP-4-amino-4,6-dideoxygalactose transaminase